MYLPLQPVARPLKKSKKNKIIIIEKKKNISFFHLSHLFILVALGSCCVSQYTPLSKQFYLQMLIVSLERFKVSGLGPPQYWTPLTFLSDVLLLPGVTEILQLWFCSIPSHTPAVQRGRYWGVPWMCAWVAAELVSLGNWDSSSRARGRASSLGQGEGQLSPAS